MTSPTAPSTSRQEASSADRRRRKGTGYLLLASLWPIGVVALVLLNVYTATHLEDLGVAFRLGPVLAIVGLVPAIVAIRRCTGAQRRGAVGALILNALTAAYGLMALFQ